MRRDRKTERQVTKRKEREGREGERGSETEIGREKETDTERHRVETKRKR